MTNPVRVQPRLHHATALVRGADGGRVMRPARNDTKVTIPSLVYAKWQPAVKMVEHRAPTLSTPKVIRSIPR